MSDLEVTERIAKAYDAERAVLELQVDPERRTAVDEPTFVIVGLDVLHGRP